MSEVNPDAGTEKPITDEASAVEALSDMLGSEEDTPAPEEQPTEANPQEELGAESPEETPEGEPEGETSTEEPESQEAEVELPPSVAELSEALGVDPDKLFALNVPISIDGQTQEVPLKEAVSGYQRDADYRRKTQDLADQRREFEARVQQTNAEYQQKSQQLDTMIGVLEQEVSSGPQESDLYYLLEQGETAEFIKQKGLIEQRQKNLNAFKQERAQMLERENAQTQQQIAEYRRNQQQSLLAKYPDMQDPAKGNEIQRQVIDVMREFGYEPEEVQQYMGGPFDHRLIDMALKYNALKQREQKGKAAVKKVALKPKVTRPGSPQNKGADDQSQELRNRLRASGRNPARRKGATDKEAAAYIKSLL